MSRPSAIYVVEGPMGSHKTILCQALSQGLADSTLLRHQDMFRHPRNENNIVTLHHNFIIDEDPSGEIEGWIAWMRPELPIIHVSLAKMAGIGRV